MIEQHHKLAYLRKDLTRNGAPWLGELNRMMGPEADVLLAPLAHLASWIHGVRRDLQEQIVKEGYRIRVYVPFGSQWYPYLMRRLAERPANIAFMAGNIVKETLHR